MEEEEIESLSDKIEREFCISNKAALELILKLEEMK
jgi:hypothetical protein